MNKSVGKKYIDWLIPISCIGIAFLHGFFLYSASSGRDDVYITYWAAQALSDFGKIVNYNGEALEQSSSLLHVILLAVLHKISGISMPVLGVFFSATMGALTILAAWRLAIFLNLKAAWIVALFLALFPYFVYWSFGGLEATLVALIVVLLIYSVILFLTKPISISIFLFAFFSICAYIMARPEAIFVMLAFLMGIALYFIVHNWLFKKSSDFLYGKRDFQKWMILVSISLIIFALLSFWRYWIFGQIFPQPVYAKASGLSFDRLTPGFHYFFDQYWIPSLIILTGLTLFVIYDILLNRNNSIKNIALMIMIAFIGATIAFSITSGGDRIEAGRFFVPILPLFVISGLYAITQILPQQISKMVLVFLVLVASLDTANFLSDQKNGPLSIPLPFAKAVYSPILKDFQEPTFFWFERNNLGNLRDLPSISMLDTVIKRLSSEQIPITVLSIQMGMVSFYIADRYFGKVKFIDMRGLVTPHFIDCSVTSHLSKKQGGINLSYQYFFSHFTQINTHCAIQKPAIIYDIGGKRQINLLEKNGYKVLYTLSGVLVTGNCWTRRKVWAGQFIAVREDLLDRIGDIEPKVYQFPQVKNNC